MAPSKPNVRGTILRWQRHSTGAVIETVRRIRYDYANSRLEESLH